MIRQGKLCRDHNNEEFEDDDIDDCEVLERKVSEYGFTRFGSNDENEELLKKCVTCQGYGDSYYDDGWIYELRLLQIT